MKIQDFGIVIYGKKGCPECQKLIAWMQARGLTYDYRDLADPPPDWREGGYAGALATSARYNDTLPVVFAFFRFSTTTEFQRRMEHHLNSLVKG